MKDRFGFTNDEAEYKKVCTFRDAAVADGWSIRATYDHESIDRVSRLTKEGFKMMCVSRTDVSKSWKYKADITIWAPDGLCIAPPEIYNWEIIKARIRHCNNCGADDVETERYSFAGRCCIKCLPAMRKQHEYSGWTR